MEINHVLIVEDDKEIREGVQIYLQSQGYVVFQAADGIEGLEILEKEEIHLAIIDIMMPRMDGIRMTMKLREKYDFPVIMLSAKSEEVDKITGLNIGADDYVTKPYRVKELLARVAVNIRRYTKARQTSQENSNRVVTFGNTAYDVEAIDLTQKGEKLECTTSALRLLLFLLQHRGQVISRSAIMEQLYDIDGEFFEDNTLSVYIKRLRQKLGEDGAYIETVRGMGYRFRM